MVGPMGALRFVMAALVGGGVGGDSNSRQPHRRDWRPKASRPWALLYQAATTLCLLLLLTSMSVEAQSTAAVAVSFPPVVECGASYSLTLTSASWNTFWSQATIAISVLPVGALSFASSASVIISDTTTQTVTVTPAVGAPKGNVTLTFQTSSYRVQPIANVQFSIECATMSTLLMSAGCAATGSTDGTLSQTGSYPPQSSILFTAPVSIAEAAVAEENALPWYILDSSALNIRKFHPATGVASTISSSFPDTPLSMVTDGTGGNLYVVAANAIYQVPLATGTATAVVGSAGVTPTSLQMTQTFARLQDGIGSAAVLWSAFGSAYDSKRNLLWVSDASFHTLVSIDLTAGATQYQMTTVAGMPYQAGWNDGVGLNAQMNTPRGLAMWNPRANPLAPSVPHANDIPIADLLFFADSMNAAVRQLNVVTGEVSTIVFGDVDSFGFSGGAHMDGLGNLLLSPDGTALFLFGSSMAISFVSNQDRLWRIDLVTRTYATVPVSGDSRFVLSAGLFPSLQAAPSAALTLAQQRQMAMESLIVLDSANGKIHSANLTSQTTIPLLGGGPSSVCASSAKTTGGYVDGPVGIAQLYGDAYNMITVVDKNTARQRMLFLTSDIYAVRAFDWVTQEVSTLVNTTDSTTSDKFTAMQLLQHPQDFHLWYVLSYSQIFLFDESAGTLTSVLGSSTTASVGTDGDASSATFVGLSYGSWLPSGAGWLQIDGCQLRYITIDAAAPESLLVESLVGGACNSGSTFSSGIGSAASLPDLFGVAVADETTAYLISTSTICLLLRVDLSTLAVTAAAGGITGLCDSDVDGYGTNSQFATPYGVAYSSTQAALFISTSGGTIRKFDVASGYLSTVFGTAFAGVYTEGAGANGAYILGITQSMIAGSLLVMPDISAGTFSLFVTDDVPFVTSISPLYGAAATSSVVTLTGANFGWSAFDITAIHCGPADGAAPAASSITNAVTLVQWVSSSQLIVQLPNNLLAGTRQRFVLSVRSLVGPVSLTGFSVVSAPAISNISPPLGLPLTAQVMTFSVAFPSGVPNVGTALSVTYGSSGTGSTCANAVLTPNGLVLCDLGADVSAGTVVKFKVTLGGVTSSVSSATFTATSTAPSVIGLCPTSLPASMPSLLFINCANCGTATTDPTSITVQFYNSATSLTYSTRRVRVRSAGVLSVNVPSGLPAGATLGVRILIGTITGAAFTTTAALKLSILDPAVTPPIVSITPNILSPTAASTKVTLTLAPAYLCPSFGLAKQIDAIGFGEVSAAARVCSGTLTIVSNTTVSCVVSQSDLADPATLAPDLGDSVVQGRLLHVGLVQQGATGLQSYSTSATSAASLYVVGTILCVSPSSGILTGATEIRCRLPAPPRFGNVSLLVQAYATTTYVTSQLMMSATLTFTAANYSAWQWVRIDVPSDSGTISIAYSVTNDAAHWVPPADVTGLIVQPAVAYQSAYGGGSSATGSCSAGWSSAPATHSTPAIDSATLFSSPVDAVMSADGKYYWVLDRNGSYVVKYDIATGTTQTVVGALRPNNTFNYPANDGSASSSLMGDAPMGTALFSVRSSGTEMIIYDAIHYRMRIVDISAADTDDWTIASGVGSGTGYFGPLTSDRSWTADYSTAYIGSSSPLLSDTPSNSPLVNFLNVRAVVASPLASGYVYFSDTKLVRRWDPMTGKVLTIGGRADSSIELFSNLFASATSTGGPSGLALSGSGQYLYTADRGTGTIMRCDLLNLFAWRTLSGIISTVSVTTDGDISAAVWLLPSSLALNAASTKLYVAQQSPYQCIRVLDLVTLYTTSLLCASTGSLDGPSGTATIGDITSLRLEPSEQFLYFADPLSNRIRSLNLQSLVVTTLIGGSTRTTLRQPVMTACATSSCTTTSADAASLASCPGAATSVGSSDGVATAASWTLLTHLLQHPTLPAVYALDHPSASETLIRVISTRTGAVTTLASVAVNITAACWSATDDNTIYFVSPSASVYTFDINSATTAYLVNLNTGAAGSLDGLTVSLVAASPDGLSLVFSLAHSQTSGTRTSSLFRLTLASLNVVEEIGNLWSGATVGASFGTAGGGGVFDSTGDNFYFTSHSPDRVWRWSQIDGTVLAIAGQPNPSLPYWATSTKYPPLAECSVDGTSDVSRLCTPTTVMLSPDGNSLYVTEVWRGAVNLREVSLLTGEVTTLPMSSLQTDSAPAGVSSAASMIDLVNFATPMTLMRETSDLSSGPQYALVGVYNRVRRVSLAPAAPLILDIQPRFAYLGVATTVTLTLSFIGHSASGLSNVRFGLQSSSIALSSLTACGSVTWVSATTCTCVLPAATAAGNYSFGVLLATGQSTPRSIVTVGVVALPTVTAVAPSVIAPATSMAVTLTGTGFGGGTAAETIAVTYGAAGVGTGSTCSGVTWLGPTRLSCTVGTDIAAGVSKAFAVTVSGHTGSVSSAASALLTATTTAPTLSGVIPPAIANNYTSTTLIISGTGFGSSTADLFSVSVGPTGTESTCLELTWLSKTQLQCVLPAVFPTSIVYFQLNVGDQLSAVSAFGFAVGSTSALPSAVVSGVSPSRLSPTFAYPTTITLTLFSATATFGDYSAALTDVQFLGTTADGSWSSSSFSAISCNSFAWLNASAVTCNVTLTSIAPYVQTGGQLWYFSVATGGVYGPQSTVALQWNYNVDVAPMSNIPVPWTQLSWAEGMDQPAISIKLDAFLTYPVVVTLGVTCGATITPSTTTLTAYSPIYPTLTPPTMVPCDIQLTVDLSSTSADGIAWVTSNLAAQPTRIINYMYGGVVQSIAGGRQCAEPGTFGVFTDAPTEYPLYGMLSAVEIDSSGHAFLLDPTLYALRQLDLSTGNVTLLAGGSSQSQVDGVGAAASFSFKQAGMGSECMAFDGRHTLYLVDSGPTIRKYDTSSGAVTSWYGGWGATGGCAVRSSFITDSYDGYAYAISASLAYDFNHDSLLFVQYASYATQVIKRINVATACSTVIYTVDRSAYNFIQRVTLNRDGSRIFVAFQSQFVTLDSSGAAVDTLWAAESLTIAGISWSPTAMEQSADGRTLYIAHYPGSILAFPVSADYLTVDFDNPTVLLQPPSVLGSSPSGYVTDGPLGTAVFSRITSMRLFGDDLLITDSASYGLRGINLATKVTRTISGGGEQTVCAYEGTMGFADGAGREVMFTGSTKSLASMPTAPNTPSVVFPDLLLLDMNSVRLIRPSSGEVTTVVTLELSNYYFGIAVSPVYSQHLAVLAGASALYRVDTRTFTRTYLSGQLPTSSDSYVSGAADGPAVNATFSSIVKMVFNPTGTLLYIYDSHLYNLRVVRMSDGYVSTLAGGGFSGGTYGNVDGVGTAARFPDGAFTDAVYDATRGVIWLAFSSPRIASVNVTTGAVVTRFGVDYSVSPSTLTIDPTGTYLYVGRAVWGFTPLYRLHIDTGLMTDVLGTRSTTFADGVAASALINALAYFVMHPTGHAISFVDTGAMRVRMAMLDRTPSITSINPTVGAPNVLTPVTLTGYFFGDSASELRNVTYGPTDGLESIAQSITWISSTQLACAITVATTLQQNYFIVTTSLRSSLQLQPTFEALPAPVLTACVSATGPAATASVVTLIGSYFGTQLADIDSITYSGGSLSGSACGSITFIDSSHVQCTLGTDITAGTTVTFVISVHGQSSAGTAATHTAAHTLPLILSICPTSAPPFLATRITLTGMITVSGDNFGSSAADIDSITYGPTTGSEYLCVDKEWVSATEVSCVISKQLGASTTSGPFYFRITIGGGNSVMSTASLRLLSTAYPTVTAFSLANVAHSSLPLVVTLTGSYFGCSSRDTLSVFLYSNRAAPLATLSSTCTDVTFFSSTNISCIIPFGVSYFANLTAAVTSNGLNGAQSTAAITVTGYDTIDITVWASATGAAGTFMQLAYSPVFAASRGSTFVLPSLPTLDAYVSVIASTRSNNTVTAMVGNDTTTLRYLINNTRCDAMRLHGGANTISVEGVDGTYSFQVTLVTDIQSATVVLQTTAALTSATAWPYSPEWGNGTSFVLDETTFANRYASVRVVFLSAGTVNATCTDTSGVVHSVRLTSGVLALLPCALQTGLNYLQVVSTLDGTYEWSIFVLTPDLTSLQTFSYADADSAVQTPVVTAPVFTPGTTAYSATVPYQQTGVRFLAQFSQTLTIGIRGAADQFSCTSGALTKYFSLTVGTTRFAVASPSDGNFTVYITRRPGDVLTWLVGTTTLIGDAADQPSAVYTAQTFSPAFSAVTRNYTLTVPLLAASVRMQSTFATVGTVSVDVDDPTYPQALTTGVWSYSFPLFTRPNIAHLVSTKDGTFTLIITRSAGDVISVEVQGFSSTGVVSASVLPLSPAFTPGVLSGPRAVVSNLVDRVAIRVNFTSATTVTLADPLGLQSSVALRSGVWTSTLATSAWQLATGVNWLQLQSSSDGVYLLNITREGVDVRALHLVVSNEDDQYGPWNGADLSETNPSMPTAAAAALPLLHFYSGKLDYTLSLPYGARTLSALPVYLTPNTVDAYLPGALSTAIPLASGEATPDFTLAVGVPNELIVDSSVDGAYVVTMTLRPPDVQQLTVQCVASDGTLSAAPFSFTPGVLISSDYTVTLPYACVSATVTANFSYTGTVALGVDTLGDLAGSAATLFAAGTAMSPLVGVTVALTQGSHIVTVMSLEDGFYVLFVERSAPTLQGITAAGRCDTSSATTMTLSPTFVSGSLAFTISVPYIVSTYHAQAAFTAGSSVVQIGTSSSFLTTTSPATWSSCFPLSVGTNTLLVSSSTDGLYTVVITRRPFDITSLLMAGQTASCAVYSFAPTPSVATGTFAYSFSVPAAVASIAFTAVSPKITVAAPLKLYVASSALTYSLTSGVRGTYLPLSSSSATSFQLTSPLDGVFTIVVQHTAYDLINVSLTATNVGQTYNNSIDLSPVFSAGLSLVNYTATVAYRYSLVSFTADFSALTAVTLTSAAAGTALTLSPRVASSFFSMPQTATATDPFTSALSNVFTLSNAVDGLTYTFLIHRLPPTVTDVSWAGLSVLAESASVGLTWSTAINAYTVSVAWKIASLAVTATGQTGWALQAVTTGTLSVAVNSSAAVELSSGVASDWMGLTSGATTLFTLNTADGEYLWSVTRAAPDVTGITIIGGGSDDGSEYTLYPCFTPGTLEYSVYLGANATMPVSFAVGVDWSSATTVTVADADVSSELFSSGEYSDTMTVDGAEGGCAQMTITSQVDGIYTINVCSGVTNQTSECLAAVTTPSSSSSSTGSYESSSSGEGNSDSTGAYLSSTSSAGVNCSRLDDLILESHGSLLAAASGLASGQSLNLSTAEWSGTNARQNVSATDLTAPSATTDLQTVTFAAEWTHCRGDGVSPITSITFTYTGGIAVNVSVNSPITFDLPVTVLTSALAASVASADICSTSSLSSSDPTSAAYAAGIGLQCAWWDTATLSYSTAGCEVSGLSVDGQTASCLCTHLTEFTILLDQSRYDSSSYADGCTEWRSDLSNILYLILMLMYIAVILAGLTQLARVLRVSPWRDHWMLNAEHSLVATVALFRALEMGVFYEGYKHMAVSSEIVITALPYLFFSWVFSLLIASWAAILDEYSPRVRGLKGSHRLRIAVSAESRFSAYRTQFFLANTVLSVVFLALFGSMAQGDTSHMESLSRVATYVICGVDLLFAVVFITYGQRLREAAKGNKETSQSGTPLELPAEQMSGRSSHVTATLLTCGAVWLVAFAVCSSVPHLVGSLRWLHALAVCLCILFAGSGLILLFSSVYPDMASAHQLAFDAAYFVIDWLGLVLVLLLFRHTAGRARKRVTVRAQKAHVAGESLTTGRGGWTNGKPLERSDSDFDSLSSEYSRSHSSVSKVSAGVVQVAAPYRVTTAEERASHESAVPGAICDDDADAGSASAATEVGGAPADSDLRASASDRVTAAASDHEHSTSRDSDEDSGDAFVDDGEVLPPVGPKTCAEYRWMLLPRWDESPSDDGGMVPAPDTNPSNSHEWLLFEDPSAVDLSDIALQPLIHMAARRGLTMGRVRERIEAELKSKGRRVKDVPALCGVLFPSEAPPTPVPTSARIRLSVIPESSEPEVDDGVVLPPANKKTCAEYRWIILPDWDATGGGAGGSADPNDQASSGHSSAGQLPVGTDTTVASARTATASANATSANRWTLFEDPSAVDVSDIALQPLIHMAQRRGQTMQRVSERIKTELQPTGRQVKDVPDLCGALFPKKPRRVKVTRAQRPAEAYPACVNGCYVHSVALGDITPNQLKSLRCPTCDEPIANAKGRARRTKMNRSQTTVEVERTQLESAVSSDSDSHPSPASAPVLPSPSASPASPTRAHDHVVAPSPATLFPASPSSLVGGTPFGSPDPSLAPLSPGFLQLVDVDATEAGAQPALIPPIEVIAGVDATSVIPARESEPAADATAAPVVTAVVAPSPSSPPSASSRPPLTAAASTKSRMAVVIPPAAVGAKRASGGGVSGSGSVKASSPSTGSGGAEATTSPSVQPQHGATRGLSRGSVLPAAEPASADSRRH